MTLAARAALVTGGGRGIGADTARALARAGASVSVAARTLEQVEAVAAGIVAEGRPAFAFRCDVTRPDEVERMVRAAREAMGRVDVLVNDAGTASSAPLARVTLEEWRRVLDVNATGTFLCTREVFPEMAERGWGRVVNVASVAGLAGARYISAYAAAKHAVVGFTRAVAAEAEGTGVSVNAVCPGYVDTPMTEETVRRVGERTGLDREAALAAVLDTAGQARLVRPDEVAATIVRLCGEEAAGENGRCVVLDGSDEDS